MDEADYDEDPIILNNHIKRLSVQLLQCQMARRKSTGMLFHPNVNGRVVFEDMLLPPGEKLGKTHGPESPYMSCWKSACSAIKSVLCGCFIAVECASVLAGIVFFHVWFITPYNVICAALDLKRRLLHKAYNLVVGGCANRMSQVTSIITSKLGSGRKND